MVTVHDVAAYVLKKQGTMTAMKLQKLIYYCQSWSLVWEDRPLFKAQIQAWANGPVIPKLYDFHKGQFSLRSWKHGDSNKVVGVDMETIDAVLKFYGNKTPQWLSDLTHQEPPWRQARKGLMPGERGSREIKLAYMAEYYGSL